MVLPPRAGLSAVIVNSPFGGVIVPFELSGITNQSPFDSSSVPFPSSMSSISFDPVKTGSAEPPLSPATFSSAPPAPGAAPPSVAAPPPLPPMAPDSPPSAAAAAPLPGAPASDEVPPALG